MLTVPVSFCPKIQFGSGRPSGYLEASLPRHEFISSPSIQPSPTSSPVYFSSPSTDCYYSPRSNFDASSPESHSSPGPHSPPSMGQIVEEWSNHRSSPSITGAPPQSHLNGSGLAPTFPVESVQHPIDIGEHYRLAGPVPNTSHLPASTISTPTSAGLPRNSLTFTNVTMLPGYNRIEGESAFQWGQRQQALSTYGLQAPLFVPSSSSNNSVAYTNQWYQDLLSQTAQQSPPVLTSPSTETLQIVKVDTAAKRPGRDYEVSYRGKLEFLTSTEKLICDVIRNQCKGADKRPIGALRNLNEKVKQLPSSMVKYTKNLSDKLSKIGYKKLTVDGERRDATFTYSLRAKPLSRA